MNSALSLYLGRSFFMISSSGPQRRLSQKPGTANSTRVGLLAAIAAAMVEVWVSTDGVAEESIWVMSLTSAAVRFLLFGAGEPTAGVKPLGSTWKRGSRVFESFGVVESTLIATPHSPGTSKLTMAV